MKRISFIPDWLRSYKQADFRFDLQAGLTVGVMLIPQGMAYALIAGLPPVYGLYASTLPAAVYAWFGTSRHLSVGPGALSALMTASGVSMLAAQGSTEYLPLVMMLALMVGCIQFILGAFRLGFLVHFLSNPVIHGFTSAAAILISLSQLKYVLGIEMDNAQILWDAIASLLREIHHTHFLTLCVGVAGILLLLFFKRRLPAWPGALITVTLAILVSRAFDLPGYGLDVVGEIPGGLPAISEMRFPVDQIVPLLPTALAVAMVVFMESTAVSRAIRSKHQDYNIVPNRELMSLGLANLASGLLQSIPVTGGMSRSTVNDQAGARTGLSTIISSVLIVLTLLFLTSFFYFLPKAVLAGVILVAVFQLFRLHEAKVLWRLDRKDFWMMMATFTGTFLFGIGPGIIVGVVLSLALIIFEASYPHHAELGKVPGTHSFRNLRRFSNLEITSGVLIYRFDAPLFFANIHRFRELLTYYRKHRNDTLHTIIIDMEGIHAVDSSAIDGFKELIGELQRESMRLFLAEVKGPVRDKFYTSGLTESIGHDHFFVTVEDAVQAVKGAGTTDSLHYALQTNIHRP